MKNENSENSESIDEEKLLNDIAILRDIDKVTTETHFKINDECAAFVQELRTKFYDRFGDEGKSVWMQAKHAHMLSGSTLHIESSIADKHKQFLNIKIRKFIKERIEEYKIYI